MSSAGWCPTTLSKNRIRRAVADVAFGMQACPCAAVLKGPVVRNVSAGGGPGCASTQFNPGALLLCPTTEYTALLLMWLLAIRHARALPS